MQADLVSRRCIDCGFIVRALPRNTLKICPPFVITEEELTAVVNSIERAIVDEWESVS